MSSRYLRFCCLCAYPLRDPGAAAALDLVAKAHHCSPIVSFVVDEEARQAASFDVHYEFHYGPPQGLARGVVHQGCVEPEGALHATGQETRVMFGVENHLPEGVDYYACVATATIRCKSRFLASRQSFGHCAGECSDARKARHDEECHCGSPILASRGERAAGHFRFRAAPIVREAGGPPR